MKKYIYILFAVCLFTACSSDNDNTDPETPNNPQNYTSFVIKNEASTGELKNIVTGYKQPDNSLKLIANLGNLKAGETSKEITIDYSKTKEVLIFIGELSSGNYSDVLIVTNYKNFVVKENTKNIYTLPKDIMMQLTNVNHSDAKEYPQE
ncbi:hypothetical protein [Dysgonomonas reticulitermitis]